VVSANHPIREALCQLYGLLGAIEKPLTAQEQAEELAAILLGKEAPQPFDDAEEYYDKNLFKFDLLNKLDPATAEQCIQMMSAFANRFVDQAFDEQAEIMLAKRAFVASYGYLPDENDDHSWFGWVDSWLARARLDAKYRQP